MRVLCLLGTLIGIFYLVSPQQCWASYADLSCNNPATIVLTPLGNASGYTSNGPHTIDCTLTTDTLNGSVVASLSGADYNTSNAELTLHHTGNNALTWKAELTNPQGFASNGLPASGTLTPGSPSETPSNFSYDIDAKSPGSLMVVAGSYSANVIITITGY